jgi:hypothetical protein
MVFLFSFTFLTLEHEVSNYCPIKNTSKGWLITAPLPKWWALTLSSSELFICFKGHVSVPEFFLLGDDLVVTIVALKVIVCSHHPKFAYPNESGRNQDDMVWWLR